MLKKLTSLVTNNFGLKVLGLLFAIILWLVIVNVEDPDKSVSFSISVDVVNAEYLTAIGKTYEVLDGTDTISFTVTGKRSIVEKLSASDFKAVANMENIDDSMTMVPIVVTATSYSNQLEITKRSSYLFVSVENVASTQISVTVSAEGTLADDCYVVSTKSNPDTLTITGPESVISQIAVAQASLDVTGAMEDVSSTAAIVLLDEGGAIVDQDRLTLDAESVVATARIQMQKSVELSLETLGQVADGCRVNQVSAEVSAITLEGEAAILGALEVWSITGDALSVEGAEETFTVTLSLEDYLPEGLSLADGEPTQIQVTIEIETQTTTEVEMPVANLSVTGLAEGLSFAYNVDDDAVTVRLTDYAEVLSGINGRRMYGTVDLSGLKIGTHQVSILMDEDYAAEMSAKVSVTITATTTGLTEEETE